MHLKVLWDLQEVEQSLEKISREIKQKDLVMSLKQMQIEIDELQCIVEKESIEIAELERRAKKIERQLESLESKKNEQENKLYSGSCNVPKELESMKEKLEETTNKIVVLEEELLGYMDQVEDKVQLVNQVTGELEDLKKKYYKGVKLYRKNKKDFEDARSIAEEKQKELRTKLEKRLLYKYEKVQQVFKNTGIAKVEDGLCSGCRIEVPLVQLKNIKEGNNIYNCEYCGRILVT
ncbi:MAG: uncharacterized protein PWP71_523 [Clostridia bacterium]|jgi:hypothetical protein|nr:uncharacterized protein [Clostridia bacterium]